MPRSSTLSRDFLKSAWVTRMRRSRSASSPASVHIALMSAPDSSSCALTERLLDADGSPHVAGHRFSFGLLRRNVLQPLTGGC